MTLIASNNILMSHVHRRWLTLREVLTVQAFPVDCTYTYGRPCSSYALRDWCKQRGTTGATEFPWPSRRSACSQSGNSMHTAVSGLVVLYALTQIMIDPENMQVQQAVASNARVLAACALKLSQSPQKRSSP